MEFSIGSQFSREFNFSETQITNHLEESLKSFFINKDYGSKVKKIYSDFICVSKDFESVVPVRPLKVLKNEPAIEYEIKIDFVEFKDGNAERRYMILIEAFFKKTILLLSNKKIKDFDFENFKNDLEKWYNSFV